MHYNLVVRLLNDRFGIQTRGGWSCASSFAHYLMQIETEKSTKLINEIENHQLANKPGWVRLSLQPIMTDAEVLFIIKAIKEIIANNKEWEIAYNYNQSTNEFDSIWQDDRELQKRMHSVFQEI